MPTVAAILQRWASVEEFRSSICELRLSSAQHDRSHFGENQLQNCAYLWIQKTPLLLSEAALVMLRSSFSTELGLEAASAQLLVRPTPALLERLPSCKFLF